MSQDRHIAPERSHDALARVRRAPGDRYEDKFARPQYAAAFPDEAGAVAVFIGVGDRRRIALFPESREWCVVRVLPSLAHDRRGEAAHAGAGAQG